MVVKWHLVCGILLQVSLFPRTFGKLELTILHTNDVHANFEQYTEFGLPCTAKEIRSNSSSNSSSITTTIINSSSTTTAGSTACYGGIARRATVVNQIRHEHENVLLLDAGDTFQGTTWFDFYQGAASAHFMNYLSYDAMALGNHELDNGVEGVTPFLKAVDFPVLACNTNTSLEPSLDDGLIKGSVVLTIGDETVGVVGYITAMAPLLTNTGNLQFEDEAVALQKEVNRLLDDGVNKIIAIGHAGYGVDLDIASKVTGIDVIVGGHSSSFLYTGSPTTTDVPDGPYPTVVTSEVEPSHRTLVVTAYMLGKYLGFLQVDFDGGGEITAYAGNPILLDGTIAEDEDALLEISKWREPLASYRREVVGESYVILPGAFEYCNEQECGLGDLITDAFVWRAKKDQGPRHEDGSMSDVAVAIVNSGGIRNSLNAGQILERDVDVLIPFSSAIVKVEMTGYYLLQSLEDSLSLYGTLYQSGSFFQVSGLLLELDIRQPVGSRVKSVYVRCTECAEPDYYRPLDSNETYSVLMTSFLSNGGDGQSVFTDHVLRSHDTGITYYDAISSYITAHSPITDGKERPRIVFVGEE